MKVLAEALREPNGKIHELWLDNNNLTDSCVIDLVSALCTNRSLTVLDLGNNKLRDSGVNLLSEALKNLECKIQKLWLDRLEITHSSARHLCSALSTNRSLRDLNLSNNELGNSGVNLLSTALRNPGCKIQKLVLDQIGFTASCARELALNLSSSQSLRVLKLNFNHLADSRMKLSSVALKNENCKMQTLELASVGLTDSCVNDFASAVSANQPLIGPNLSLNFFTDKSVPALHQLIKNYQSLKWIRLWCNRFSFNGEIQLRKLHKIRSNLSVEV
ncbi:NACHT, LRR and PYD domains-containing protein 3-like [Rhincodon typus]|uniref:NACHT, LRR and PYD domains-containing protein 3-like n=1 Tax=Rhincodon typus TaxID=259920 RepID=UPI00202FE2E7|nr:NACHT, LRR and PYD domains-containing protein 3-like [Rhincodon typus]XP_048476894.1 NACHT, LRR and PYD domains-containing protein 3-like [Rhincodon typus]XP_048476895.1 NACHT, LRR and PYD domains-containing protein 3-like [Rhincodon typus]